MKYGECGHPVRVDRDDDGYYECRLCWLLRMTRVEARDWGRGVHLGGGGREGDSHKADRGAAFFPERRRAKAQAHPDEANAWYLPTPGPIGGMNASSDLGSRMLDEALAGDRRRTIHTESASIGNELTVVRLALGDAWRDANPDGPAMTYGAAADLIIGHTSREVPAWNERRAVRFLVGEMTDDAIIAKMDELGAEFGKALADSWFGSEPT